MPENGSVNGGAGRDAPDRPDENDRGGAREDKEKAEKAESFDRALDNANRPDRAPAAPSDTTTDSDDDNEDDRNTTDKTDDRQDRVAGPPGFGAPPSSTPPTDTDKAPDDDDKPDDRGFLDHLGDTLTAPPTDAEGNARSTSPVSDRINNTVNYSLDDLRDVFTPEQSEALADGAAVMDGVVTLAPTTPKEQISLYQADLRLQQRGLEYQKEQVGNPGHPSSQAAQQIRDINLQLEDLADRRELVETVTRPDLTTGVVPEILHFDPKEDGQIVVAHGDIRNASHIAVMVPGMTTDLENFQVTNDRAKGLLRELSLRPNVTNAATISYLGYDAPDDFTQAVFDGYAVEGAPVFSDFLDTLPEDAETHVLAHSYGSLLTGKALAEGARPEYAHIFGSPGIGVDALNELNLEGNTVVTVTSNPGDRVVSSGWHGDMPPQGAISYPAMGNPPPEGSREAEDYEPHVDYFNPDVLADIVAGKRQPITIED